MPILAVKRKPVGIVSNPIMKRSPTVAYPWKGRSPIGMNAESLPPPITPKLPVRIIP